MHDRENIYFAFRCEESKMKAITARGDNQVRFEQLLACGEDLVEIILDPGLKATSPEGLYHIVIKSNGIIHASKGIASSPPLGKSKPWPVSAKVAVGKFKSFWAVEVAIPLESLGPAAGGSLWGANFTRFDTSRSEASNWSCAKRYYYHCRGLGTMMVAPEKQ